LSAGRDSVVILFKGGRLPEWPDLSQADRERFEQECVDLMRAVGREHGLAPRQ
jgi:hypothetical protein